MYANVKKVLTGILDRFKSGDIPQAIAYSVFPIPDIPSAKWSLLNRTLMFFAGTQDARGFKQWAKADRCVKKGAKAFHILGPRFKKTETKEGDEKTLLIGFLTIPVFRVEDTQGEPLDYQQIALPELPLIEVAQKWNISVKAIPGNYRYHGYYSDHRKEIAMATEVMRSFSSMNSPTLLTLKLMVILNRARTGNRKLSLNYPLLLFAKWSAKKQMPILVIITAILKPMLKKRIFPHWLAVLKSWLMLKKFYKKFWGWIGQRLQFQILTIF